MNLNLFTHPQYYTLNVSQTCQCRIRHSCLCNKSTQTGFTLGILDQYLRSIDLVNTPTSPIQSPRQVSDFTQQVDVCDLGPLVKSLNPEEKTKYSTQTQTDSLDLIILKQKRVCNCRSGWSQVLEWIDKQKERLKEEDQEEEACGSSEVILRKEDCPDLSELAEVIKEFAVSPVRVSIEKPKTPERWDKE